MKIEEAINIVKNVFATTKANLADHQAMQMAIQVIEEATKLQEPNVKKGE